MRLQTPWVDANSFYDDIETYMGDSCDDKIPDDSHLKSRRVKICWPSQTPLTGLRLRCYFRDAGQLCRLVMKTSILENTADIPIPSATRNVTIGTGHLQKHQRSVRTQARRCVRN
jgi:hypothetical protein